MKALLMNKKGEEEEFGSKIVVMLFSALMLLITIALIHSFMTNIEVTNNYRIANLRFNNMAARIMFSPDCFAFSENAYELSGFGMRKIVRAGVLDEKKMYYETKTIDIPGKELLPDATKKAVEEAKKLVETLVIRDRLGECLTNVKYGITAYKLDPQDFNKREKVLEKEGCKGDESRYGKFIVVIKPKGGGKEVPGLVELCYKE